MHTDSKTNYSRAFPWVAVGALVLVNALWGISFPIVKVLNALTDSHFGINVADESNAFRLLASSWLLATRFSLAFILLLVFAFRLVYETTRREWWAGCIIGVLFFSGMVLQVIGLATIPASRSGFLTSLTTVFTPIFGIVMFRIFPSRWMVIGVVLALFGVVVLTGLIIVDDTGIRLAEDASERWTLGDTMTTIASMFFAFQVLLLDHFGKQMRSLTLTCGMFVTTAALSWLLFAALVMSPWFVDADGARMQVEDWGMLTGSFGYLASLFVLASLCSVVSFGLMNRFQPHVTASQAAIIYSLEPVFASTWALFLPSWLSVATGMDHANEVWTWNLVFGGVLILVANVVALLPGHKPAAAIVELH
ncbi:MAG: DMT family transporter [Pirellula sp.]|jgi:drug/metabolite transporter (DMT)-like permease|nr:DMT family transporter [Pirellula sp.]